MEHAREKYEVSERHACRLLGQWRRTQHYAAIRRIDEEVLLEAIIALKVNTVATDTGELRRCCNVMAGKWVKTVCNGSGDARKRPVSPGAKRDVWITARPHEPVLAK